MAGQSTFYDRVRAVYDLDDSDDDDGGGRLQDDDEYNDEMSLSRQSPAIPSPTPEERGAGSEGSMKPTPPSQSPQEFGWNPQAPTYQPTPPRTTIRRNMIRVPFDPEDQSDDEVVTEAAHKRQQAQAHESQAAEPHRTSRKKARPVSGQSAEQHGRRTRRRGHAGKRLSKKAGGQGGAEPDTDSDAGRTSMASDTVSDAEPVVTKRLVAMEPTYEPLAGLFMGERCRDKTTQFCPWRIVTKYHKWFVGVKNGKRVEPYFQVDELLKCQTWQFYYVWHPSPAKKDYVLVVPTEQLVYLLDRINRTLGISLGIPQGDLAKRFRVTFGEHGTPQPRFLCHAPIPRKQFNQLRRVEMPPLATEDMIYTLPNMTHQVRAAYVKKFDSLLLSYDKKGQDKKRKSEKNRKRRLYNRRLWNRQTKRMQRYLGLRGTYDVVTSHGGDVPRALNLDKPAPFKTDGDILFVVMDIECYEFNHSTLTEIGFGLLDSRDTAGVAPGPSGKNWFSLIQGRHLRIREHAHMVNRVHVKGCENNFNFGESEFVSKNDILQAVENILQPKTASGEPRKVVLIGHNIASDISLVSKIGFKIDKRDTFWEIVDTQHLHQHYRMNANMRGLGWVLRDLDIDHSYLHNGGNDAVYTMQAFISLLVEKRQASLRRHHERQKVGYLFDPTTLEEGWNSGGEESDGGNRGGDVPYDSDSVLTPRRFRAQSACSVEERADGTPPGKDNPPARDEASFSALMPEVEAGSVIWF